MENEQAICKGLQIFAKYFKKSDRYRKVYILTNYNTNFEQDYYRAKKVMELGYSPDVKGFVMVSYNNAPEIVELYQNFYIFYTTRANSMSHKEGEVYEELIMTNYDPRPFLQQKNHQMNLFSFLNFWTDGDYKPINSPVKPLKIYRYER